MTQTSRRIEARLDLVPQSPGVYLMKNAAGSIIYVGKAVNLRNRLSSYFTARLQGNAKVQAMIARIDDFETILCANELEALILESTLIKKHQPPYNILLRDDRDYPYIRVTMHETYPRVLKAFRIGDDRSEGARYFGPYMTGDVYFALEALRTVFPLKTCRRVLPRDIGRERPCLNFHIGRCIGPCKGDVSAADYRAVMTRICRFFEGRTDSILTDLRQEMAQASEQYRYEQAALLRDRIQALERLMQRQKVVSNKPVDRDVLGLAANGSEICLHKLEIRQGRLVAAAAFFWPEHDLPEAEVLRSFLLQHYPDAALIPPEILLPADLPDLPAVAAYLQRLRGARCTLRWPRRGEACALLGMAAANASEVLRRHTLLGGGQKALQEAILLLAGLVGLEQPPTRIEALDISNTGNQDQAAGLVVFQDGRPLRQHYRQFRLEPMETPDDYHAMRTALRRRLQRLGDATFGSLPDLILADGGIGHVAALRQVMRELNLSIPVAGMVKDDRHRTRGLVTPDGQVINLRPSAGTGSASILADADTTMPDDAAALALLRLLTAIQDEAHRFAGRYRQKLHNRRQLRFSLENIAGVGPARRRLLLQHFHSIKKIAAATLDELKAVHGLDERTVRSVYDHFHAGEQEGA